MIPEDVSRDAWLCALGNVRSLRHCGAGTIRGGCYAHARRGEPVHRQYIAERKRFAALTALPIPPGVKNAYDLTGTDSGIAYLLDVHRGTIKLSRIMFQNRVRVVEVLARVDVNGRPHTNPDHEPIGGSHFHVYREGYEDKWAQPLDPAIFSNPDDIAQVLEDFCTLCNIDDSQMTAEVGML